MPSSCASLRLLLLLLLGASCSPVQNPEEFVPKKLRHHNEVLAEELELRTSEIGSNPMFGAIIRSFNTSCQALQRQDRVQLINATLDVYMRIFSSLLQADSPTGTPPLFARLQAAPREKVIAALSALQNKMEMLRSRLRRDQEDLLDQLNRIKVDDPVVQRKALAELPQVYQAASVLVHSWRR